MSDVDVPATVSHLATWLINGEVQGLHFFFFFFFLFIYFLQAMVSFENDWMIACCFAGGLFTSICY